ncbi:TPA: DUF6708 domain-containing protein, partial [Klebsiella michiganensis]
MTDNLFARAKPKLNPPVSAWKADMPESREPQLVPPRLIWMNKINDVYLEIPRYDKGMTWWGMIPLGGGVLGIIFYILIDTISTQIQSDGRDFIPYFIALAGFVFFLSMFLSCIKIYFIMPREQPVRLNKMRQRIFVYKYKRIDPIPWMKWPVIITRYNWADVHGEIRYCSDRYR